jgi:cyclophilin family peptidyl-prolyl cis-trans isomerase
VARGSGPSRVTIGFALALPFIVFASLLVWSQLGPDCTDLESVEPGTLVFAQPPCPMVSDDFVYRMDMETTAGPLRIVLDPILACDTVNNLVFLTKVGFYDGIRIHKVEVTEDHAFVQIGDRSGTGRGTAGYTYTGEAPSPITRYVRGTAAMVFAGDDPATASSQFFVVIDDYKELSYPARQPVNTLFGGTQEPESLRTLDIIRSMPRDGDRPVEDIVIERATISEQRRFGEEGDPVVPCAFGPRQIPTASESPDPRAS